MLLETTILNHPTNGKESVDLLQPLPCLDYWEVHHRLEANYVFDVTAFNRFSKAHAHYLEIIAKQRSGGSR